MQGKKEQRDLVQHTVNAKSLGLLQVLVGELKLSCSGCHLHGIVAEAPLDLLVTLVKLAGSLNARHPELKSTLIHKVSHRPVPCQMHPMLMHVLLLHGHFDLPFLCCLLVCIATAESRPRHHRHSLLETRKCW